MRQPEFLNECRRLYGGCNAAEQLTGERLDVLWQLYGKLDLAVWAQAVNYALLDHRLPNASSFERLVDRAEIAVEKHRAGEYNAQAKNWPAKLEAAGRYADPEVAEAALTAIRGMMAKSRPWSALEPWWEAVGQRAAKV